MPDPVEFVRSIKKDELDQHPLLVLRTPDPKRFTQHDAAALASSLRKETGWRGLIFLLGENERLEDMPTEIAVRAMLKNLSPDKRLEVMRSFCAGCGTDKLPCHCRNGA